jgi:RNA polymerase sigma factor (TIGR02999 family)
MHERVPQLTRLLKAWGQGQRIDRDQLASLVYDELHAIAEGVMRRGVHDTLQPTAVVHEAWLRLEAQVGAAEWSGRKHFYAVAAKAMRHVLADHARRRGAHKRGQGFQRVTLDAAVLATPGPSLDVVALDDACTRLSALDSRQAQIVELRFFAGLTIEETAEALAIAPATVKDEWRVARAWLRREMEGAPPGGQ